MKTIRGNLLDLAEQGMFDIILHGCNCQNTMKSGIAGEIAKRYPEAVAADQKTIKGDQSKLGKLTTAKVVRGEHTFTVVNMYTQFNYGRDPNTRYVDYWAVWEALYKVASSLKQSNKHHYRIGYPKFGAGLANGDWEIISKMIDEVFKGFDHTLVLLEG